MALRNLRYEYDELLRKTAKPVKNFDHKLEELLDDMHDTLRAKDGLGLAAPQVGVLRRVVVIHLDDVSYELVNPEMLEADGSQVKTEACLSLPGLSGIVERPAAVKVKAQDRAGETIELAGEELMAVAICHEMDHLNGVLFIDKATEMTTPDTDDDEEYEYDDEEYDEIEE